MLPPFEYEFLIPIEGEKFCGKISNELFILNENGEVFERRLSEEPRYFSLDLENDGGQIETALVGKDETDSIEQIQSEDNFSAIFCPMYSTNPDQ